MAQSIERLSDRFKRYLEQWLPQQQIEDHARRCGHRWRVRKLGPAQTIHLLLMQLLACNTALSAARHLSDMAVTASALCQARARLPLELLRRCAAELTRSVNAPARAFDWCGRAVLAADGVCYYAPDTSALRRWLGSKNAFGYPLMKALTLLDLSSGVMLHQIPLPHRRGEAPLLTRLLRCVAESSVVVMDRAFASFANIHVALTRKIDLAIRIRKNLRAQRGSLRQVIKRLGKSDLLVRWERPHQRCGLLSRLRWKALPEALVLRQVSFSVRRRGYRTRTITVITTLLDPKQYPAEKIAELYSRRWEIETQFRHIKQTLNWEMLRCRSIAGVKKELLLRQMAFNTLRGMIASAAQKQQTSIARISFADALRCLLYGAAEPGNTRLLHTPHRPGRTEPRRRKKQDKNYVPLTCPRSEARKKAA
jgi:hypothetical protein